VNNDRSTASTTLQADPINREAERDRVQGSDASADPLEGGRADPAAGSAGQAAPDPNIRSTQNEPAEDIAAQRRDVVGFTHDVDRPPAASGRGEKGEKERLGANTGGHYTILSENERNSETSLDEKYSQMSDGAFKTDDSEFSPSRNSGDPAAPYNQVPKLDLDSDE